MTFPHYTMETEEKTWLGRNKKKKKKKKRRDIKVFYDKWNAQPYCLQRRLTKNAMPV